MLQTPGREHSVATASAVPAGDTTAVPANAAKMSLKQLTAKLPLGFEPAAGGSDAGRFVAKGRGYALGITPGEARLHLITKAAKEPKRGTLDLINGQQGTVGTVSREVRIKLANGNENARATPLEILPGKSNYLIGNDQSKWRRDVPSYAKVKYESVYPGIDLLYYGTQGRLEYDFVVNDGADPSKVRMTFSGADSVKVDAKGDLVLMSGAAEVRQGRPVAYQEINGSRRSVEVSYAMQPDHSVGFQVGNYDTSAPLVIDPYVGFSSYFGKVNGEDPWGLAVDSTGVYFAGATGLWYTSANTTTDYTSYDTSPNGGADIFLTKLSLDGTKIIYTTYIGGNSSDFCYGLAVDASQNVYLTGYTASTDYPAVNNWQVRASSQDAYITKMGPTGNTVVYSSFLGGTADDTGIAVTADASGNAYVTGSTRSTNMFPAGIMTTAAQSTNRGDQDVFVAKIAPTGGVSGRLLGTYLGGSKADAGRRVHISSDGYVVLTGATQSDTAPTFFPTTAGALYPNTRGSTDIFVTKLNANFSLTTSGGQTAFSTYLGGSQVEESFDLALDSSDNIYVVGTTGSSTAAGQAPYPTTNPYQGTYLGNADAVLTKLSSTGAMLYSTYFGAANNQELAYGVAVNNAGKAWIVGYTRSSAGFPILNGITGQLTYRGGDSDGFVARFDTTLSGNASLLSSTLFGGNDADEVHSVAGLGPDCESVFIYGNTRSASLLPIVNPYQATKATNVGDFDAFLAKIDEVPAPVANAGPDRQVECPGGSSVTLAGSITSGGMAPFTYEWSEGGVVFATTLTPTISLATGAHTLKLKVMDSCYSYTTDTVIITVSDTTPPTITYTPANVSLPNDLGECFATYNPGTITATEACSTATITAVASPGNLTITPNASRQWMIDPGTDADGVPGTTTYTITWTAKDAANNSSTSVTTITVSDTEAPVFTVPPTTISTPATQGAPGTFVNPGTPTATDNCTVIALVGFRDNPGLPDTGTPADLQGQYPLGTSIITWIAIDEAYNFTEAYQSVTVTGELTILSNFDSTSSGPSRTFTADVASDVLTSSGHGFKAGNPVRVTTSGALPGGLAAATTYYVISPTAVSFKLSATLNGSAINITTAGSGTNQAAQVLNDGTDGWTSSGGTFSYQATGGNTAGHVRGSDASASSTLWYFRAPAKFRGNRYASSSVLLTFDLRRNTGTSIAGGEDVLLTGGGLNIYATLPSTPPAGSWQSYSLLVNTSVAWKVKPGGATANAAQIRQVLESLQEVKIRGKWNSTAAAEGDVDNVALKLTY